MFLKQFKNIILNKNLMHAIFLRVETFFYYKFLKKLEIAVLNLVF
jgi:hypothetical protein